MKRLITMLLTFAMLMSFMSMSAFAAENEPDTGIITEDITWEDGAVINGATIKGETEDAKLIRGNDFYRSDVLCGRLHLLLSGPDL